MEIGKCHAEEGNSEQMEIKCGHKQITKVHCLILFLACLLSFTAKGRAEKDRD